MWATWEDADQEAARNAALPRKRTVLDGADAALMRQALHHLNGMTRDESISNDCKLGIRLLRRARARAVSLLLPATPSLLRAGFGVNANFVRRVLVGTAPGLNPLLCSLNIPRGLKLVTTYLANDFFRGFGQTFWCCNPWSGACFLLAILNYDAWLALAVSFACVVAGLTASAAGTPHGIVALGLTQFDAMIR